jgi:hypothetical protein
LARFRFGEPVSRGPITSVSWASVSITLELEKPSSRIRAIAAQSTDSSAATGASATSATADARARVVFFMAASSTVRDVAHTTTKRA